MNRRRRHQRDDALATTQALRRTGDEQFFESEAARADGSCSEPVLEGDLATPGTDSTFNVALPIPVGSNYRLSLSGVSVESTSITCAGSVAPFSGAKRDDQADHDADLYGQKQRLARQPRNSDNRCLPASLGRLPSRDPGFEHWYIQQSHRSRRSCGHLRLDRSSRTSCARAPPSDAYLPRAISCAALTRLAFGSATRRLRRHRAIHTPARRSSRRCLPVQPPRSPEGA